MAEIVPETTGKVRHRWMDIFRGMAIILVLAWHAPAIPVLHGYHMPRATRAAFDSLLPFRMPGLMFLSGMLLSASLRKPLVSYYEGKVRSLLWPYLIWAALAIALYGSPNPLWRWQTWWATSYLWFLFYIGVYYAIAPLIRWIPVPVVPVLLLAINLVDERIHGFDPKLSYFAIFFFAGNIVGSNPGLLDRVLRRWVIVSGTIVGLLLAGASAYFGTRIAYQGWTAPAILAGLLAALAGVRAIANRPALNGIAWIGRSSIIPYTAHFPIMTGVVALASWLGVANLYAVSVLDFAIALPMCVLLVQFKERAPISWLFLAPMRLPRSLRQGPGDKAIPVAHSAQSGPGETELSSVPQAAAD